MEPWMWILIAVVGVLLLFMLFRASSRPVRAGRPVAARPRLRWRRPAAPRRRAYWR